MSRGALHLSLAWAPLGPPQHQSSLAETGPTEGETFCSFVRLVILVALRARGEEGMPKRQIYVSALKKNWEMHARQEFILSAMARHQVNNSNNNNNNNTDHFKRATC